MWITISMKKTFPFNELLSRQSDLPRRLGDIYFMPLWCRNDQCPERKQALNSSKVAAPFESIQSSMLSLWQTDFFLNSNDKMFVVGWAVISLRTLKYRMWCIQKTTMDNLTFCPNSERSQCLTSRGQKAQKSRKRSFLFFLFLFWFVFLRECWKSV